MSVGILIITHGRLCDHLIDTVRDMLGGKLSLQTEPLEVRSVADPDALIRQGQKLLDKLDDGSGVLVLTDAFGSTPSNIANKVATDRNARVVTGLNLPMLIRIYNYPKRPLAQLAETAVEGGQRGVMLCQRG